MCRTAYFNDTEIETVAELRAVMREVVAERHHVLKETSCLCWVDIETTAKLNGFSCVVDVTGDYVLAKAVE